MAVRALFRRMECLRLMDIARYHRQCPYLVFPRQLVMVKVSREQRRRARALGSDRGRVRHQRLLQSEFAEPVPKDYH